MTELNEEGTYLRYSPRSNPFLTMTHLEADTIRKKLEQKRLENLHKAGANLKADLI